MTCSPLELARMAGWDRENQELETALKTAVAALELAGYIKRGQNVPHVYATSLQAATIKRLMLARCLSMTRKKRLPNGLSVI